ncbi:MAG TPA: vitamin K epoxide reductase family protein [Candidatus Paceibacterota bacterium]|nr:vitamin K epoxide reductase family protein [Candidatus Paceibacterota bacterium]
MEKPLLAPFYLIAATFIGLADTLYLSYFAFMNAVPGCAIGGCEAVLTSAYSKFFGVPLAYIGLVFYIYMLALAVLLAMEPRSRTLSLATLGYTLVGLGLSLVFEFYIQGMLIGEYCMYCAISAVTTLALFGTAVWHFRSTRVQ